MSMGRRTHGGTMNHHNIATCISLAESLPRDRETYRVLDELLIELRFLAKAEEAKA